MKIELNYTLCIFVPKMSRQNGENMQYAVTVVFNWNIYRTLNVIVSSSCKISYIPPSVGLLPWVDEGDPDRPTGVSKLAGVISNTLIERKMVWGESIWTWLIMTQYVFFLFHKFEKRIIYLDEAEKNQGWIIGTVNNIMNLRLTGCSGSWCWFCQRRFILNGYFSHSLKVSIFLCIEIVLLRLQFCHIWEEVPLDDLPQILFEVGK